MTEVTIDNFQEHAARTMFTKSAQIHDTRTKVTDRDFMILWNVVGLVGEVGEVWSHWKNDPPFGATAVSSKIWNEFGDLFWYAAAVSTSCRSDFATLISRPYSLAFDYNAATSVEAMVEVAFSLLEMTKKGVFHRDREGFSEALVMNRVSLIVSHAINIIAERLVVDEETPAHDEPGFEEYVDKYDAALTRILQANVGKLRERYPEGFVDGGGFRPGVTAKVVST